jgi:hypothetical protein
MRRILSHARTILSHPGAKSRPFRPTATPEPRAAQRLAITRRGEIDRITPHEKKEINLAEPKIMFETPSKRRVFGNSRPFLHLRRYGR